MKTPFSLCLLALCLAAATASAQEAPRFEVSVAGFTPKTHFSVDSNLTVSDGTAQESYAASAATDDRARGGQVEARWRITPRQRLEIQAYRASDDRTYPFDYARSATDTTSDTTYTAAATGHARLDTRFDLASINYGYDLVQGDRLTLTGLVGVYGARLKGHIQTAGTATLTDGVDTASADLAARIEADHRGLAPGVGIAGQFDFADRWSVRARVQGFRTEWGSFSHDGRFFNAQATVNYAMTPRWSAFAGYDWFDLRLEDDLDSEFTSDGTTYTARGPAEARLRVNGPVLGARYSF